MPTALRVPEHSVARRRANQGSLVVERQNSQHLNRSSILIQMLSAAVCGTDLAILSGIRADRAEVLGHEGVGVVLHAPEGCSMSKGDRVIVNPVHAGHPQRVIGHSCDGIFRELFWIDAFAAVQGNHLVTCPKECGLEDVELVVAEPLASVLYSFELLREKCGDSTLLIRGAGTIGILAARLWLALTGSGAILVSKSAAHVRWLRQSTSWPANVRICSVAELARVLEETGNCAPRAAILCCSREDASDGLSLLLDFVAEDAIIDLMAGFPPECREARLGGVALDMIRWNNICGISKSPATAVVDRLSGKAIYLVGHRGTSPRHILQAIELLSCRLISISDIPHRVLALEHLPEAMKRMSSRDARHHTRSVKTIVSFSGAGSYKIE